MVIYIQWVLKIVSSLKIRNDTANEDDNCTHSCHFFCRPCLCHNSCSYNCTDQRRRRRKACSGCWWQVGHHSMIIITPNSSFDGVTNYVVAVSLFTSHQWYCQLERLFWALDGGLLCLRSAAVQST